MIDSKLVKIYLSLNKQELRLLNKWVASPIADVHIDAQNLIAFLYSKKYLSEDSINKKDAFSYLYKKKTEYDDLKLRHIMSDCTKAIEDFLAYSYFANNKTQQGIALIKNLKKHQLSEYAEIVLQKIKQQRKVKHDISYYLDTRQLEIEQYYLTHKKGRKGPFNNQAIIDIIQQIAVTETLKQACIAHSDLQMNNSLSYSCTFLPFIVELIESKKIDLTPSIEIYYYIYKDINTEPNNNDESDYLNKLLNALYKYEPHFTKDELYDMYCLCINRCITHLNATSAVAFNIFYGELSYKLIEHGLKKKYIIKYNELDRFRFNVFIQVGVNLGYYIEIENFISEFGKYLHKDYREDTISYGKARLYYVQKDYKNAMLYLLSTELKDPHWNLSAKFILIKIYFEIKQYVPLKSLLTAANVYLSRQTGVGYLRNLYKNYFKYSKKLYSVMINQSKQKKENLKKQIESDKDLITKSWFLEQLK